MKPKVGQLEQVLEATFGRAFLAHLLGLQPFEILVGTQNVAEISRRARNFKSDSLGTPIFEVFAKFIRDYPFGLPHDWIRLSEELRQLKQDLANVLSEITQELLQLDFVAGFDHAKQFVVAADRFSQSNGAKFETQWKSNADAWWTHPNTLISFQARSQNLSDFAIDDSVIQPTAMAKFPLVNQPRVYEIQDANDWLWLVERYPTESKIHHLDNWHFSQDLEPQSVWMPDWHRVALHFEAVYLSPVAYLGISYQFLKLPDGRVTFLSGWSPGATFWLPQTNL
jgi:hypothetical protein